jgi:glycosidase
MQLFFNSRDTAFKRPFGAVRVGRAAEFSFPFGYDGIVYGVSLIVRKYTGETVNVPLYRTESAWNEARDDENQSVKADLFDNEVKSVKADSVGNGIRDGKAESGAEIHNYKTDLILSEEGIYFYSFEVYTGEGTRFVGRGEGGGADFDGGEWQLTVYDKYPETPHPLAGGVIYHIFADRFRKGKTERETGCGEDLETYENTELKREKTDRTTDCRVGTDGGIFVREKIDIEKETDKGIGTDGGIFGREKIDIEKETDKGIGTDGGKFQRRENGGENRTKIGKSSELCRIESEFSAKKVRNSPKIMKNWEDLPTVIDPDGVFRANDFFGGNAEGIVERLDYIADLGVNILYLSPIFEAASNHRYDTGDYFKIDPLFGDEEALKRLVDEAARRGMIVMMDGVFNHTGADSVYFNRYGNYDSVGAYQSKRSKFYGFYDFVKFPDKYRAWWGIEVVPTLNKANHGVRKLVRGVIYKWMSFGIKGLRLDVADELPKDYIFEIRRLVKTISPDSYLLGEVWEDASTKISYGTLRPYLLGSQLDSVMNYPFKEAVLEFVKHNNREKLVETVMSILENYPKYSAALLMNIIGTHDTVRAINSFFETDFSGLNKTQKREVLEERRKYEDGILNEGNSEKNICVEPATYAYGLEIDLKNSGEEGKMRAATGADGILNAGNFGKDGEIRIEMSSENAEKNSVGNAGGRPAISPDELKKAVKKLKIAALIQFTLPGIPSVYYGDEVGLLGFEDPLNRAPYPYGRENSELLELYRTLGRFRRKYKNALSDAFGEDRDAPCIRFVEDRDLLIYKIADEKVEVVVNNSEKPRNFEIKNDCFDFLTGREFKRGENIEVGLLEGFLFAGE